MAVGLCKQKENRQMTAQIKGSLTQQRSLQFSKDTVMLYLDMGPEMGSSDIYVDLIYEPGKCIKQTLQGITVMFRKIIYFTIHKSVGASH